MDHDDYEDRYHTAEKIDILNRGPSGLDPDRFRTFDDSEDEDRPVYGYDLERQRSSTTSFSYPLDWPKNTPKKAEAKTSSEKPSKPIPISGNRAVSAMIQQANERSKDLSPAVTPTFPYTQARFAQGVASKDFASTRKNSHASSKSSEQDRVTVGSFPSVMDCGDSLEESSRARPHKDKQEQKTAHGGAYNAVGSSSAASASKKTSDGKHTRG